MDQRSSTCIENTLHNQESKAVVNTYEPPCNFVLVPISLVAIVNFVITRYIVLSGGVENAQGANVQGQAIRRKLQLQHQQDHHGLLQRYPKHFRRQMSASYMAFQAPLCSPSTAYEFACQERIYRTKNLKTCSGIHNLPMKGLY